MNVSCSFNSPEDCLAVLQDLAGGLGAGTGTHTLSQGGLSLTSCHELLNDVLSACLQHLGERARSSPPSPRPPSCLARHGRHLVAARAAGEEEEVASSGQCRGWCLCMRLLFQHCQHDTQLFQVGMA